MFQHKFETNDKLYNFTFLFSINNKKINKQINKYIKNKWINK